MSLEKTIIQSNVWADSCNRFIGNLKVKSSGRNRVAAALFHLAIEHQASILLLTKSKYYGSAFALFRSLFEAYIRGFWFHHCATEKELTDFLGKDSLPTIDQLITSIENLPISKSGSLSNLKGKLWKNLCSFAHGGYAQVSWRMSESEIGIVFEDTQVISLLNFVNALALETMLALSVLTENEALSQEVIASHQEIFNDRQ